MINALSVLLHYPILALSDGRRFAELTEGGGGVVSSSLIIMVGGGGISVVGQTTRLSVSESLVGVLSPVSH